MFNIKKLKKLGYGDSISFKVHIVKNDLSYLQDRIRFSLDDMEDYTRFIVKFFIDIYVSDLENDIDTKAGFMEGYFILPEEFMEYSDFLDVCDAHSQELSEKNMQMTRIVFAMFQIFIFIRNLEIAELVAMLFQNYRMFYFIMRVK